MLLKYSCAKLFKCKNIFPSLLSPFFVKEIESGMIFLCLREKINIEEENERWKNVAIIVTYTSDFASWKILQVPATIFCKTNSIMTTSPHIGKKNSLLGRKNSVKPYSSVYEWDAILYRCSPPKDENNI